MSIYKAYDIRGRYPEEINEEIAERIGRAFVQFTKCTEVMVARDARTHSPSLTEALVRGITTQGADVTEIGIASTPQTIAMHIRKGHQCAIMVTASHLDAPFNGMKMYAQGGRNITAKYGMREMEALVTKNVFETPRRHGSVRTARYVEEYANAVRALAPQLHPPHKHFIADCSNGVNGEEVENHRTALHLDLSIINATPDGTFPAHSPNPIAPGAGDQIAAAIKAEHAAGGCIFDADADRITFFDENGRYIHPNAITCLIASELLRSHAGRTIAYDLISSRAVPETVRKHGGVPLRTQVGRNILVDDMRREHAIFGGETSSHMIYGDLAYADATTLSMLIVFAAVERSGKPMSTIEKQYLHYALLPETNYHIERQAIAMEMIVEAFPEARVDKLDGVALIFPDGWIVARPSNTEPLLRLRAEADTQAILAQRTEKVEQVIRDCGGVPERGH